jgi:hypothetical protein
MVKLMVIGRCLMVKLMIIGRCLMVKLMVIGRCLMVKLMVIGRCLMVKLMVIGKFLIVKLMVIGRCLMKPFILEIGIGELNHLQWCSACGQKTTTITTRPSKPISMLFNNLYTNVH